MAWSRDGAPRLGRRRYGENTGGTSGHGITKLSSSYLQSPEAVMRFVISFICGFVAEIATGLVIGAGMAATGRSAMASNPADFPAWVPYVAMVAGFVFTFVIGWWRASRDRERAIIHAMLVAVAAVALHLVTSVGAGQPFTSLHAIADVCKLIAGVAAGLFVRSRSSTTVAPA